MLQCCAVFVGVFIDNDKEGFENYTLFNACYSAALCLQVFSKTMTKKGGNGCGQLRTACLSNSALLFLPSSSSSATIIHPTYQKMFYGKLFLIVQKTFL